MQTRKWQDQNGQDRYTTEVVISGFDGTMQMLGGGNRGGDAPYDNNQGFGQQQGMNNQPMGGGMNQAPQQSMGNQGNQGGQQMPPQGGFPPQNQGMGQTQPMQPSPAPAINDFEDDNVPF